MNITDHMNANGTSSTIKELTAASGKSETWVRTNIKKVLASGTILEHKEIRPTSYSLKEEPKPKKASAKKRNLNPQPKIEAMKAVAKAAGVKLFYDKQERLWNVGEHFLTAAELAGTREGEGFEKWLDANC